MQHTSLELLASQLLQPLHALKLDAEYHENSLALAQSKLALDIVESTLLLHRLESQQTHLDLEPVHIGDVVSKAMSSLREYFAEHHIDYELDVHSGIPVIHADRTVVEHAVKMLLYGVQMMNQHGSVLRLYIKKDKNNTVKLRLVARELESDRVILHLKNKSYQPMMHPIDASRSLFKVVGGMVHKTRQTMDKGFAVTLPSSEQLTLV